MGGADRRRGRPRRIDARRNQLCVKVSDRELGRMREMSEHYDVSVNEVLRMALKYYYENVF